ncbi:MAG: DUF3622 domain-containing protein [Nitrosomonas sp.]|nr:DUF3622 domain-containing protein [Nitrosomonas sp.]MDP1949813.1 DUF3622 domain-containing protein [Nitrosomonas sp.]
MTKSKKYDYQVIQDNTCWSAKIIRQVTSKKTIVSKRQDGFATESDAEAWGQSEIKAFLQNLNERNKRRSRQSEKEQEQE